MASWKRKKKKTKSNNTNNNNIFPRAFFVFGHVFPCTRSSSVAVIDSAIITDCHNIDNALQVKK